MIVALDTSVLLSIFKAEADGENWLNLLIRARGEGLLVVSDVVYAELAPAFDHPDQLEEAMANLGISFDPVRKQAAWLAGTTFKAYRQEGGPRTHLIPDFLIAAHARTQADQLAAVDRGYLRRYFPRLDLLQLNRSTGQ